MFPRLNRWRGFVPAEKRMFFGRINGGELLIIGGDCRETWMAAALFRTVSVTPLSCAAGLVGRAAADQCLRLRCHERRPPLLGNHTIIYYNNIMTLYDTRPTHPEEPPPCRCCRAPPRWAARPASWAALGPPSLAKHVCLEGTKRVPTNGGRE